MKENFKVAFVTNDAKNIIGAFGASKYFAVFNVEDGNASEPEIREVYKDKVTDEVNPLAGNNLGLGVGKISLSIMDPAKEKHMKMAKSIADCDIVVARRMCENAWDSILQFKMTPYRTKIKDFQEGIMQIINESMVSIPHN